MNQPLSKPPIPPINETLYCTMQAEPCLGQKHGYLTLTPKGQI